jgi:hypothetical protein
VNTQLVFLFDFISIYWGVVVGWVVRSRDVSIGCIGGENEKAGSSKKQEGICQWDLSPLLLLLLLLYVFSCSSQDLPLVSLAISVSLPNLPPCIPLPSLLYTTIHIICSLFALLFINISLFFSHFYPPTPTPSIPPLLKPLRQLLFQPPNRAVAIRFSLHSHKFFALWTT